MAISANSYGSVSDVEGLARVYTDDGVFTPSTIPTRLTVEGWIDQVSALINLSLAAQGFAVPVTNATAKLTLDSLVNQLVSDVAHGANSAGRFFTERALTGNLSMWAQVRKDIDEWVSQSAAGLSALGVSRTLESQMTVGFRDGDDDGNEVSPLFIRDQFGSDLN